MGDIVDHDTGLSYLPRGPVRQPYAIYSIVDYISQTWTKNLASDVFEFGHLFKKTTNGRHYIEVAHIQIYASPIIQKDLLLDQGSSHKLKSGFSF
jgi:hypothetical protein